MPNRIGTQTVYWLLSHLIDHEMWEHSWELQTVSNVRGKYRNFTAKQAWQSYTSIKTSKANTAIRRDLMAYQQGDCHLCHKWWLLDHPSQEMRERKCFRLFVKRIVDSAQEHPTEHAWHSWVCQTWSPCLHRSLLLPPPHLVPWPEWQYKVNIIPHLSRL